MIEMMQPPNQPPRPFPSPVRITSRCTGTLPVYRGWRWLRPARARHWQARGRAAGQCLFFPFVGCCAMLFGLVNGWWGALTIDSQRAGVILGLSSDRICHLPGCRCMTSGSHPAPPRPNICFRPIQTPLPCTKMQAWITLLLILVITCGCHGCNPSTDPWVVGGIFPPGLYTCSSPSCWIQPDRQVHDQSTSTNIFLPFISRCIVESP